MENEFLALMVVEIPQQAMGKAWREELQRTASRLENETAPKMLMSG